MRGSSLWPIVVLAMLWSAPVHPQATAQVLEGEMPLLSGDNGLAYRKKLATFAKNKAGADAARYWAIVRRGLDAAERLTPPTDANLDALNLGELNAEPAVIDRNNDGQMMTRMRLRVDDAGIRIVGGIPIPDGTAEEVVAIEGNDHLCSGIVVTPTLVLTAAHCVAQLQLDGTDERKIVAVTSNIHGFPVDKFMVSSAQIFGGTGCSGVPLTPACPDLALVSVDRAMQVPAVVFGTDTMLSQALPRPDRNDPGFHLFGFGCTRPIRSPSGNLNCLTSRIGQKMAAVAYQSRDCANANSSVCHVGEFILWNDAGPIDTCAGDSGGPVMLPPKQEDAFGPRLVGITSRSFAPNGECGPGGIYTKVTSPEIIAWLNQNGVAATPQ